jgi:hypothetical protein
MVEPVTGVELLTVFVMPRSTEGTVVVGVVQVTPAISNRYSKPAGFDWGVLLGMPKLVTVATRVFVPFCNAESALK